MSKKRKNKSRLTKTDVNTICEMQKFVHHPQTTLRMLLLLN